MANLPSAMKRAKQNEARRARNQARKSRLKSQTKKLLTLVHDKETAKAESQLRELTKALDQTAAKGTLHRNTAARRKSRLAHMVNALKAGK